MEMNEVITEINALAAKRKRGESLTEGEEARKKELYAIYLGFIRGQVVQTLERIEFVDEEPER